MREITPGQGIGRRSVPIVLIHEANRLFDVGKNFGVAGDPVILGESGDGVDLFVERDRPFVI